MFPWDKLWHIRKFGVHTHMLLYFASVLPKVHFKFITIHFFSYEENKNSWYFSWTFFKYMRPTYWPSMKKEQKRFFWGVLDEKTAIVGFPRKKLKRKWVYLAVGEIYVQHKGELYTARFCVWSFFSWDRGWPEQGHIGPWTEWPLQQLHSPFLGFLCLQGFMVALNRGRVVEGCVESVSELSSAFQRAIRLSP